MSENSESKPEIKLPFETTKFDVGEWVYNHQMGVFSTLAFYMFVAILFVSFRISVSMERYDETIAIDLQPLAELERERDELIKSLEELQLQDDIEWEQIQNVISNEASTLDEAVEGAEGVDDMAMSEEEIYEAYAQQQQRMAENRMAYEQGLADLEAQREMRSQNLSSGDVESMDVKVEGNVTVSYVLINPIRHARELIVPSYMCHGGGEVSIAIVVNHSGEVVSAKVISGGDDCMQQAALKSAKASLFNLNKKSPARQNGRITYLFVPQ